MPHLSLASLDWTHVSTKNFLSDCLLLLIFIVNRPSSSYSSPHPPFFLLRLPLLLRLFPSFPSNKKGAGILDRAAKHKIPCKYLPVGGRSREAYDEEVSGCLKKAGVQLVLMVRSYHCVKEVSIFSK